MKKIDTKVLAVIISSIFFFTNSCVEDNIIPALTGELNSTAELLVYLESLTGYPNTIEAPALINAEEVNSNINSYLIIDIRQKNEFTAGHIENSVNIIIDSLFDFVEGKFNSGYVKIILVSKNGQSAAYFACLLRLGGFSNVYSMSFGLASWNEFFADEWLSELGNDPEIQYYNNVENFKNNLSSLPEINFENPEASLKDRVNSRIKKIISEGFVEDVHFQTFMPIYPSEYLICYGKTSRLYFARSIGPLARLGHKEGAIFYQADPKYELRSTDSLQTLPNSSPILIYDGTGELSACMVAYLRVLGYNARTLLFGANQLFYDRMINDPELIEFVFSSARIKNFPYITGN